MKNTHTLTHMERERERERPEGAIKQGEGGMQGMSGTGWLAKGRGGGPGFSPEVTL